jgi:hypothetical protein
VSAVFLLLLAGGCAGEDGEEPTLRSDYASMQLAVELLGAEYPEATDTAVRHDVLLAVYCSVVHGEPVPRDFGMFTPAGDEAVRSRVESFVQGSRSATSGLSEEERIEAVWGDSWGEDVYLEPRDCDAS